MWMAFDIETYEKYTGENDVEIKQDMITEGDRKHFDTIKKVGNWYPVLNSRKFVIGTIVTDKGERLVFKDHNKMLNWIIQKITTNAEKGQKTYLYAHNVDYDLYGIIKDSVMELINEHLQEIAPGNLWGWKIKGKFWGYFINSYTFFKNMSVYRIGKILGYEKLTMPEQIENIDQLEAYCMRDSEIVLKGMQFLKEKMEVLGFTPRKFLTAGQLAMSTFLSSIRKEGIHWNIMRSGKVYKGKHLEKCRMAYRGARNEAFKLGKIKDCTLIDINSLYPYAMIHMPFPKLNKEMFVEYPLHKGLTIEEMLKEEFIGCIQCQIKVPDNIKIGYLPIRYNEHLHFPQQGETLRGTWTTLELRKAKSLGYKIEDIEWVCLYPVIKENVFEGYITKLYELRKKSGSDLQLVIKLIMNNLYGKWAQFRTNKEYKIIFRSELYQYKKEGWEVKSVWGNKYVLERMNTLYNPGYTNVLIASLITAYGRDYLYKFLEKIDPEDLVYCDTDSILLTNFEKYKKEFEFTKELGAWKKVCDKEEAFIKGEKKYRIGKEIKVSGINWKVLQENDFDTTDKMIQKNKVGIRDVLNSPEDFLGKMGSFQEQEKNLRIFSKRDTILPEIIDERKEWVNIVDEE